MGLTKSDLRHRAQYAKEFGEQQANSGIVEDAKMILSVCNSKLAIWEIMQTWPDAYKTILRVWVRQGDGMGFGQKSS